jgi:GTP cyclohydrolase I
MTQTPTGPDGVLDWVGMNDIALPICFDAGNGDLQRSGARVCAFVDLVSAERRGIHMSRLYLLVDEHLGGRPINVPGLQHLLEAFLRSHQGLSQRARISIRFEHFVRRTALCSINSGWRAYPVLIEASLDERGFRWELGTDVLYSSTCPASAALSRQLIQQKFASEFDATEPLDHAAVLAWLGTEEGIAATPHAQRSTARIRARFVAGAPLNLIALLDRVEQSLGTPVQTAVKREDERAFARANSRNLMFCEDAARRIRHSLETDETIVDFSVSIEHHESLHPHDAAAYASKQGCKSL